MKIIKEDIEKIRTKENCIAYPFCDYPYNCFRKRICESYWILWRMLRKQGITAREFYIMQSSE